MCLDATLKRDFIGFHIEIKLLHLHYIPFSRSSISLSVYASSDARFNKSLTFSVTFNASEAHE